AARSAVDAGIKAARRAGEINSPSRRTEREIGRFLGEGVAVGIDKSAKGIRASMSSAVDLSGVTGTVPDVGANRAGSGGVTINLNTPVHRDPIDDIWTAAATAGVVQTAGVLA